MLPEQISNAPVQNLEGCRTYKLTDIAKILRLGERTLYDHFKNNCQPFLVLWFGKTVRIDRKSFCEWFHGGNELYTQLETYTVQEVAQMLDMQAQMIYKLFKNDPPFRFVKLGANVRIHKQSFNIWYPS